MPPVAAARVLQKKLAKPSPGPGMTWGRVWYVLPIAGIFDLLRLIFVFFIFTAPILVGSAAALATSAAGYGATTAKIVGGVAGFVGAGAEFIPAIGAAVEGFGVIMAMITGIAGFILIALILVKLGIQLSGRNSTRMLFIFVAGVVPFADGIPSLTPLTYRILHAQIKDDKKRLVIYEAEQAQVRAQLQRLRAAEGQRQALELQAAEQEQEEEQIEAANDNEAIPEDMQEAA